jgi:hypothetical protein
MRQAVLQTECRPTEDAEHRNTEQNGTGNRNNTSGHVSLQVIQKEVAMYWIINHQHKADTCN